MVHRNLGSTDIVSDIETKIQQKMAEMNCHLGSSATLTSSEDLEVIEQSLHFLTREIADLMSALKVQRALDSAELGADVRELAKLQSGKVKNVGQRVVKIRFAGGSVISVRAAYYSRNCDRRKKGKGFYPGLCLLGIHDHCTPELASQASMASAALSSLEEARHLLASRGCVLDIKTLRNIVKRFSARARLTQEKDLPHLDWGAQALEQRRIVVSTDGGRLRVRKQKPGPKTKKGHTRYNTDWREPKLFIIYVVDDDGRQDRKCSPYLDGVLDGPDVLFALLAYYLKKLNVSTADKLLFVADGALWIWDRVKPLLETIGLNADQVYELIDFYHAVEHLNALAKLKSGWTEDERNRWVRKYRRCLKKGKIADVIAEISLISKGTKNKLLRRERDYFIKNQKRMEYGKIAKLHLPLGSGAIESSIRRVVNLRLKGACIYWHEDSANEMLLLRCYYKAGRWDMLKKLAFQAVA